MIPIARRRIDQTDRVSLRRRLDVGQRLPKMVEILVDTGELISDVRIFLTARFLKGINDSLTIRRSGDGERSRFMSIMVLSSVPGT